MAESKKEDYTTINTKSLKDSFDNIMGHNFSVSPNCSIFRIPPTLYRQNEAAYKPRAFSFGPFHHAQQLEFTQKIKREYLQGLLRRSARPEELYLQLIEGIRSIEAEARLCYAESVEFDTEKFVEMLLFDGCFVVELLRKFTGWVPRDRDDPIFSMACLLEYLFDDLVLLENQIPWLVLDCLFKLTKVDEDESLIQLALDFLANIISTKTLSVTADQFHEQEIEIKHILDLLRHSLILPLSPGKLTQESLDWEDVPSATTIRMAGMKIEAIEADSILDIKFSEGVLQIPPISIDEGTETIFRNLISIEQCIPNYSPIVTCYARFMDNLIETERDVKILCMSKTINNWLSPEDAKKSIKGLYYDAHVKEFYYDLHVSQKLNSHISRRWPRLRLFYLSNFTSPWAVVSQIVAAITLILVILQTMYSILGVVNK